MHIDEAANNARPGWRNAVSSLGRIIRPLLLLLLLSPSITRAIISTRSAEEEEEQRNPRLL